jgi:hypothetical protein
MTRTVVIGACSNARDYSFCSPLAALLWREVVGYESRWYLIGTGADWVTPPRNLAVRKMFELLDLRYELVELIEGGYEVGTQAQNIRHHVAASSHWDEDTWLMLTDADLFPLKRDWYHQHEGCSSLAVSYYSNGNNFISKENVLAIAAQQGEYQDLPTCHLTMRVKTWRDLFGNAGMSPRDSMKRVLDAWLKPRMEGKIPSAAGWQAWMSDQRVTTEKLCRADWFPNQALLIERKGQPPVDRLDRAHPSDWQNLDVSKWLDCHTIRPADQDPHWAKVRPIFAHLVPSFMDKIDAYRESFVSGY